MSIYNYKEDLKWKEGLAKDFLFFDDGELEFRYSVRAIIRALVTQQNHHLQEPTSELPPPTDFRGNVKKKNFQFKKNSFEKIDRPIYIGSEGSIRTL